MPFARLDNEHLMIKCSLTPLALLGESVKGRNVLAFFFQVLPSRSFFIDVLWKKANIVHYKLVVGGVFAFAWGKFSCDFK